MNWVQNHLCTENSSIFLLNWTHLHKVIGEIQQAQEGRTWYWLRNNNASYSISNTFSCRNENNYVYTHTQPHTTFSMTEKDNMLTGYLLRLYTHRCLFWNLAFILYALSFSWTTNCFQSSYALQDFTWLPKANFCVRTWTWIKRCAYQIDQKEGSHRSRKRHGKACMDNAERKK